MIINKAKFKIKICTGGSTKDIQGIPETNQASQTKASVFPALESIGGSLETQWLTTGITP